jgi:hypothetical protein
MNMDVFIIYPFILLIEFFNGFFDVFNGSMGAPKVIGAQDIFSPNRS